MSCWCLPEQICGHDTDDLFAYPTIRYTLVRDRRLGLLRYLFMSAIFFFIVIYQIFYNGSHLVQATPEGTVQFTLMQPMNRCNASERKNPKADCGVCYYKGVPTSGTHDGWYSPDCYNDIPPVNELPYCSQSPDSMPYPGKKVCDVRSFLDVQHVFESSILVTTRETYSTQDRVCSTLDSNVTQCDRTWTLPGNSEPMYVAGIEAYTLMFDHSMEAPQFSIRAYSAAMRCRGLHMPDSIPEAHLYCQRYSNSSAPCMIHPNITNTGASSGEGSDFFRMDLLLAAAGVKLDDVSFDNKTYRYTGVTLTVTVQYYNRNSWRFTPGSTEYDYKVDSLPHADYKLNDGVTLSPNKRAVYDRHGVRVVFIRAGTLHAFEFNELLIQLTASLTLFAVANLLVDFLCTTVLPYHAVYRSYKYIKTIDFSDLRDAVEEKIVESGMQRKDVLQEFGNALESAHDPFQREASHRPSETGGEEPQPQPVVGWFTTKYAAPARKKSGISAVASEGVAESDRLISGTAGSDGLVIQERSVGSRSAGDRTPGDADLSRAGSRRRPPSGLEVS
eukprot:Hpha_TRINITY_DN15810_c1_g8::TRINITY_DN15810_c1_g8_i1::g.191332::m.191332